DLVRDLHLETELSFGKARERHGQTPRQLMAGSQIELRRQRLGVHDRGLRPVEEFLSALGKLLMEVVLDLDVRLLRGRVGRRAVNPEDYVEVRALRERLIGR